MKKAVTYSLPSALETGGIVFLSIMILLVGNAKDLLERYGLLSSSQIVKDRLAHGVDHGLTKLDSFRATNGVVTFVVWGAVGLVTFSFVQALLRASNQIRYEKQLSSNEYVHPANFNRRAYWRQIVRNGLVSFLLLACLVVALLFYIALMIPLSFLHARRFLLQPSAAHISELVIGLVVLAASTYIVYALLKITVIHHRRSVI